jgi:DegV family protein with EDD domain
MANIKIVTDSAADIPSAMAEALDIAVIPLHIQIGEKIYRTTNELGADQFYDWLQDEDVDVNAFSPPGAVYEQFYRKLCQDYDYVFSIHMSGRINNVFRQAQQARDRLPASATRIEVIDSKLFSMAEGLVAVHAAQAVKAGAKASEVGRLINSLIQHCHLVFFVDSVDYLENAGRLSLASTVLGSMQRIKPLLLLDEGEIVPYERTRTRAKAIEGLFTFIEDFPAVKEVIALYSTTPEDIEKLLEKVEPIFPRDQVQIMQFGTSVGAHLGPGAMGVAVFEGID